MADILAADTATNSSRILQFSEFLAYHNGYHIGGSNQRNKRLVQNFICENYGQFQTPDSSVNFSLSSNKNIISSQVFPNPVIDELNIQSKSNNITKVEIFSVQGIPMFVKDAVLEKTKAKVDVSNLPSGIYFVKFSNAENSVNTFKFLKT